ncbi:MAG TPA: CRISPR-associated protein Cas5 [Chroococcidiopsis sp.]
MPLHQLSPQDYKETYFYPRPSTLYGLLLSLVGEYRYGCSLGVVLVSDRLSKWVDSRSPSLTFAEP